MTAAPEKTELDSLDVERIMRLLPHRYPMLMVDKVIEMVKSQSAIGIKNVTINEPFFQGHFPGRPVMPGVMIIESMAQTAAVLVVHSLGQQDKGKLVYFMSIDNARFRRPIVPGDQMRVYVMKEKSRGPVWRFGSEVKVDGVLAAEATFTAMIEAA